MFNKNEKAIQLRNQRDKIIQEVKRQWLNVDLHVYEILMEQHEQYYQNEFKRLT